MKRTLDKPDDPTQAVCVLSKRSCGSRDVGKLCVLVQKSGLTTQVGGGGSIGSAGVGRRQGVLALPHRDYAQGEMVLGKRPAESQVSVGILESKWCTWLGAVSFAKFNIKWVILQTSAYLHIVRRRLPQTTILVQPSQQVDWLLLSEVQMVFCDHPPGASSPIWKFPLLTDVVAWCRPRRPLVLKDFSLSKFHIIHDQVGGVSDFCAHILHYHSAQVAPICITPLFGGSVKNYCGLHHCFYMEAPGYGGSRTSNKVFSSD